MTKISALSDIGTSVASNDTFVLVDVSDPTTPNKKIQQQNLFLIPDGSAGTPGLRFLSDTDVGLFRPTTNTLAFATGGSERLRIDSSGRVGIGTTAPNHLLQINSSSVDARIHITNSVTGSTNSDGFQIQVNNSDVLFHNAENGELIFQSNSTERFRCDTSGRLLVGTSTARGGFFGDGSVVPNIQLEVSGTRSRQAWITNANDGQAPEIIIAKSRGTSSGGVTVVQNNDELGMFSFQGTDGTDFTEAARIQAFVDGTPGTNDMPGRLVFSTTADGASSPTERMRIDSSGNLSVGTTSVTPGDNNNTTGISLNSNGRFYASAAADHNFNKTADGVILAFRSAGVNEGAVSISGTTVTYGGGHLARWSQLLDNADPSGILKGTVMSNLDEMCDWGEEDNEQLNRTKISDIEGDPNVAGVFVSTSFNDEGPFDFYVGMTGDMVIRIAQGTTVARGDLLMSAGDGTAKPQDDDIIRSKTIAKVTSTNVSETYADGSYCVPCVLMAC